MVDKALRLRIDEANEKALEILLDSQPVWLDVSPAIEVLPGMTENTILHAGPPIEWERMCGPQRNGVINAARYEGLADSADEAALLVERGEIRLAPCNDHQAVGGMAGITSASMPLIVVENQPYGHRGYSQLYQGPGIQELRWDDYDEGARNQWRWLEEVLGPALGAAIRARGTLDIKNVIARALQMGDECHNRNSAGSMLLLREMMPWLLKARMEHTTLEESVRYLSGADQFFLCISMAAARAIAQSAMGYPYSTLVTTLSRNGVEFGIKVSALGDRWFTAPANMVDGLYFSSEWSRKDAVPDLGDSAIMETVGLGGLVQATAPTLQQFVGGSFARAVALTREMRAITIGTSREYQLPNLDFEGAPVGIDIRKVMQTGITPIIDTAIAHTRGGVIGAGQVRAPMGCFAQSLEAFYQEYVSLRPTS
jgi:hypothetical protein